MKSESSIIYSDLLSSMYDSMNCMVYHFNEKKIDKINSFRNWTKKELWEYCGSINNFNYDDSFWPFYRLFDEKSFFTSFFDTNSLYAVDKLSCFWDNPEVIDLMNEEIYYYYENKRFNEREANEIDNLNENFYEILLKLKNQIYILVDEFERLYAKTNLVERVFKKFSESTDMKRLLNFVGSDVLPWKKIFICLSFTSRYMTRLFTSNDKGYVSVIVGLDYEKFCGEFLPENFNYLNINNVSKGALSYPQNTLIFELIKRYGSLSSAQLAELLNVPVESIYRGLRKLCVEEILTEDWDYYSDTNYREKNV